MPDRRTGPGAVQGSRRARQIALVILETLSGELTTREAAAKLALSLARYYQLEARGLQGFVRALEPRAPGRAKTPGREIEALKTECRRLEKELRRHQALLRAAHRSMGLPSTAPKPASSKKKRVRSRGQARGQRVLQTLRRGLEAPEGGPDGTPKRSAHIGGHGGRKPARA